MIQEKAICPVHDSIQKELSDLTSTQKSRKCSGHEARLNNLEKSDSKQWDDINQLKKIAWKWGGIVAALGFIGSILGSSLGNKLFSYLITR